MRDGCKIADLTNYQLMQDGTPDWTNLSKRLEECYTGAVYDVLRDLGMRNCVLPHAIRAIDPGTQLAGRVFTMQGRPDPNCSVHESVLRWTEFLSVAPEGHVIVCQPQDHSLALMGELSAETLHLRGVKGYIVDGGCRDNAFIRKLGYRYSAGSGLGDMAGAWTLDPLNNPVVVEGMSIRTGDFVLADIDVLVAVAAAARGRGHGESRR